MTNTRDKGLGMIRVIGLGRRSPAALMVPTALQDVAAMVMAMPHDRRRVG